MEILQMVWFHFLLTYSLIPSLKAKFAFVTRVNIA